MKNLDIMGIKCIDCKYSDCPGVCDECSAYCCIDNESGTQCICLLESEDNKTCKYYEQKEY